MADLPDGVRGIRLGSIKGAAIVLQPSTLLMLLLLAYIYADGGAGPVTAQDFSMGVLLAVLLFVSVFLHELAHAIAAWSFGRTVSAIVLTLWGGHTTFDARQLTPKVVSVTALAGPLANFAIALVAWVTVQAGLLSGIVEAVVQWLVVANILLGIFNILPGIPLDGGKVLAGAVWSASGDRLKGTRVAGWAGRIIAIAVAVGTIAFPFLRGSTPTIFTVVFAALLFSVIWPAASAAIKAVDTAARREVALVSSLMQPAIGVPFTSTVADARAEAIAKGAIAVVVLSADGTPAAVTNVPLLDRVPLERRDQESLQSVTTPLPRGAVVRAGLGGEELITSLREWYGRTDAWAVVDGDVVVGVARLEDVLNAVR